MRGYGIGDTAMRREQGDGGDDKNVGIGFIMHTLVGVGHLRRVEVSA